MLEGQIDATKHGIALLYQRGWQSKQHGEARAGATSELDQEPQRHESYPRQEVPANASCIADERGIIRTAADSDDGMLVCTTLLGSARPVWMDLGRQTVGCSLRQPSHAREERSSRYALRGTRCRAAPALARA